MKAINIYLNFEGKTEEAFNFYKAVFGGEFAVLQRFNDTPHKDSIPSEDLEKIMHIRLPLGNGNDLMGTDTLPSMKQTLIIGSNINISLHAESKEEADILFNGLSEGGTIEMAMQDTFWNSYYGMFKDKYGVPWMINYEYETA